MLIDREALISSKSNVIDSQGVLGTHTSYSLELGSAPGLKLVLSEARQGLVSIVLSLTYT